MGLRSIRILGSINSIPKFIIITAIAIVIILTLGEVRYNLPVINISPVYSQNLPNSGWYTLGYDIYHSSYIPLTSGVGNINTPKIKWYYIANLNTQGQYVFSSNALIINIDNSGNYEVVAIDGGGRLIILDASTGSLLSMTYLDLSTYSVPVAADLDNDNNLELIVCTKDGYVKALDIDPATWTVSTIWQSDRLDMYIGSSPILYDINNDNILELAIATRSGVYLFDSRNGNVIWSKHKEFSVFIAGLTVVGDINGDSVLDFVLAEEYGKVYGISGANGATLWSIDLWVSNTNLKDNLIIHTPLAADLDGDGAKEIIISIGNEVFDWIGGTGKVAKTGVRGYVVILNPVSGVIESIVQPPTGRGLFAWFSQPAMATGDVDADALPELFIASSDGYVYRVDYQTGSYQLTSLVQTDTYWPNNLGVNTPITALSIAICDIDGDNNYELVVQSTNRVGNNPGYTLYSINPSNGNVEWSLDIQYNNFGIKDIKSTKANWPSISIWDIDNDNQLEIILTAFQVVVAIDR